MITAKANIANGCIDQEALISPLVKRLIDLPNPQPGHQWNPRLSKGQRLKCWGPYGSIRRMPINAPIQKINSKGKPDIISVILFICRVKYEKNAISKKRPI